jgi:hypothetical protein
MSIWKKSEKGTFCFKRYEKEVSDATIEASDLLTELTNVLKEIEDSMKYYKTQKLNTRDHRRDHMVQKIPYMACRILKNKCTHT